jgi:hypothetical protein
VELAQIAVDYAVKCAADPNYTLPQYAGMTVETIFPTDVDKYSAFGEYADALTNKISPSPSLQQSPAASAEQASPSASDDGGETEED